ncbi:SRPBCC family protein [Arthrobacter sp. BPSS-3]|uniref:SRPBCC family protein n=1 Tax=Arthrobacter sp. BPSS-3 TaxID=3366580 RepID=UPI0037DD0306
MSTKVEKRILVNVPVSVAYNQWTQFEEFPHFLSGVKSVQQLSDDRLEWTAEIAGVRRQWQARILEQIPDQKVAWAATEGATNAGAVTFEDLGGGQTSVELSLEYEPEGMVETVGDKLNVVARQAESDLDRFKAFIEDEGYATGAWRGTVQGHGASGTPGVEDAAASRGSSGTAGVSGKVIAGVGLAAAAAGVAAAVGRGDSSQRGGTDAGSAATADSGTATARAADAVPPTGTTGSVFPGGTETTTPAGTGSDSATERLSERSVAKPFDQTNGLIDDDGDSDGTAAADTASQAERDERGHGVEGTLPPAGGSLGQH